MEEEKKKESVVYKPGKKSKKTTVMMKRLWKRSGYEGSLKTFARSVVSAKNEGKDFELASTWLLNKGS